MNELKHWLDEASEADEFERAILRAGLEADPPEAKQDQIWSGLVATLAVAPLAAAAASTQAAAATSAQSAAAKAATAGVSKAAAVWLAVGKGFLVGLAVYAAAAGVSEISNRPSAPQARASSAPRAMAPARVTSRNSEPSSAASVPDPTPASEDAPSTPRASRRAGASASALTRGPQNLATNLPSAAAFDDSEQPSSARLSQLEAETRALRRARDELRASRLADAFATLEASRLQFSAPELYQEREALMIELLYRSGQVTAAELRAKAFLSRFPESPHAQQIRRFSGQ
jgi:hypothetical protein